MERQPKHTYIDFFYRVILFVKGASAVIEIAAGIFTFFVTEQLVVRFAARLAQDELFADPRDRFSAFLLQAAHQFSIAGKAFVIAYLLSHGIIRLFLVVGLLQRRLGAYYLSFVVFGGFIIYQLYRYSHTHSLWLLWLSVFDVFFIWLIWKEYTFVRARIAPKNAVSSPLA